MRLAFYKGKSLVSRLIRWKTRGKYSHVAIMFDDGRILEAWHAPSSVRWIKSLCDGHTAETPVDIFTITPDLDEVAAIEFAQRQVGKEYGFLKILKFLTNTSGDNPDTRICSEIALAVARAGGVDLLARVGAYKVSPSMLSWSPHLAYDKTVKTTKSNGCG